MAGDLPDIFSWEGCLYSLLVSDGTSLPSPVIYVSSLKSNIGNASLGFRTMVRMRKGSSLRRCACAEEAAFVRLWGTAYEFATSEPRGHYLSIPQSILFVALADLCYR
jgi:hypothetical protein